MALRLLGDENTSHRLVSACQRLISDSPIVHTIGARGTKRDTQWWH